MKKLIICFLFFSPIIAVTEEIKNEPLRTYWSLSYGIPFYLHYNAYDKLEKYNNQKDFSTLFIEIKKNYELNSHFLAGLGFDLLSFWGYEPGTYADVGENYFIMGGDIKYFPWDVPCGPFIEAGLGWGFSRGFESAIALNGGIGVALELSPKSFAILLGVKYYLIYGAYNEADFSYVNKDKKTYLFTSLLAYLSILF